MLALVFVFSGSIRELINGEGVIEFIGYTLAFMALIIMRFTKRKDKRPFKVRVSMSSSIGHYHYSIMCMCVLGLDNHPCVDDVCHGVPDSSSYSISSR